MDFHSAGFSRKNLKGVLNYVSKQLRKKVYSFAYLYSEKVGKGVQNLFPRTCFTIFKDFKNRERENFSTGLLFHPLFPSLLSAHVAVILFGSGGEPLVKIALLYIVGRSKIVITSAAGIGLRGLVLWLGRAHAHMNGGVGSNPGSNY